MQDPTQGDGSQPPAGGNPPPPPPPGGQQGGYQPPPPPGGQQGGSQPMPPPGGQQGGHQDGSQPMPPPGVAVPPGQQPPPPETYTRPRPPDDQLGIGSTDGFATKLAIPAHPNTTFAKHGGEDEQKGELYFLKLLSGSISLTKNEKSKIIEAIPKLSQYQIDELVKILEEEIRKFAELDDRHQEKIKELQAKQAEDWNDLETGEEEVESKAKEEEDVAALRSQLLTGKENTSESEAEDAVVTKKCEKCEAQIPADAEECPNCKNE